MKFIMVRMCGSLGRRRRCSRGAAMVEAVVVIPFFIIIFASIVFVGKLYTSKLRVMRLSKESAWNFAISNCGNRGDPLTSSMAKSSSAPTAEPGAHEESPSFDDYSEPDQPASDGQSEAQDLGGDKGQLASQDFESSVATMKANVSADAVIGGMSKTVTSRTRVICNEAPFDGNLAGFVKSGWQTLSRSWEGLSEP